VNPDLVIEIGQQALWTTTLLLAPLLVSALAAGLLIGMFQAATQINEMTLTFIPKLAVVAVALALFGPWMLDLILDFTRELILNIPELVGVG
jgi:flagellar biosynthesis protein FliQ